MSSGGTVEEIPSPVAELRKLITAAGIQLRSGDSILLGRALERIGDVGVTADAILMFPRPDWLSGLIGEAMLPDWVGAARR